VQGDFCECCGGGHGWYGRIALAGDGRYCLGVQEGKYHNGSQVKLQLCGPLASRPGNLLWELSDGADFSLRCAGSGPVQLRLKAAPQMCLDVHDHGDWLQEGLFDDHGINPSNYMQIWQCNVDARAVHDQQYFIDSLAGGHEFRIRWAGRNQRYYLDLKDGEAYAGTPFQVWSISGRNQIFANYVY